MVNFSEKKKILVAMSGGVDSSVVATILKEQGHDVIGVTMQLYDQSVVQNSNGKTCCAGADIYDAKMVAEKIGIDHYVLDYESVFKQDVIDNFIDSYARGNTPVPCIRCNQTVKFRDLINFADTLNIDIVATGHYMQKKIDPHINKEILCQGFEEKKDQSYFLFATTEAQLSKLIFPLGGVSKEYTRSLAKKYDLDIHDKPDSQNICFVPDGDYSAFIKKAKPDVAKSGDIMHIDGYKIGTHEGIINYTIGQRRRLGVAVGYPLYVISIDPDNNIVYLGEKHHLKTTKFRIIDINWLAEDLQDMDVIDLKVKIRSTTRSVNAIIKFDDMNNPNKGAEVTLLETEYGVSPGQACVAYYKDRVLGGGWIERVK
ncbi:MAG TPA: tRNA 2-thiouridine(34) synthase MnmA [Candidatus Megaira endosymbiont of Hartmannula sinica]|nr:tRNA 2-thiouridine(34) synthase MnmA [Candidatus Megaera endosymbiont of Hartmannula sinica]